MRSAQPLGVHAPHPIAPPTSARPSDDAVWVGFEKDDDEQWELPTKDGAPLCELPCDRWIKPKSELYVQRVDEASPSYRAYVPAETGFAGGTVVRATVLPKRGGEVGPAIMYAFSFVPIGAIAIGSVCLGADCGMSPLVSAGLIAGGAAYITGAAYWFFWSRGTTQMTWKYERSRSSQSAPIAFSTRDGAIVATIGRNKEATVVLGAGFLGGSF